MRRSLREISHPGGKRLPERHPGVPGRAGISVKPLQRFVLVRLAALREKLSAMWVALSSVDEGCMTFLLSRNFLDRVFGQFGLVGASAVTIPVYHPERKPGTPDRTELLFRP